MSINWIRLGIGISLLINAALVAITHPGTVSLDTLAIVAVTTACFAFLLIALSFETKHNK